MKHKDARAFLLVITDAGFDPYESNPFSITAMQKHLSKFKLDELLTAYIEKSQGKSTLVPESDIHPTINNAKTIMEEIYMNKNKKVSKSMKIVTVPYTHWSYSNVWNPKSINAGTPMYRISLITSNPDTKTFITIETVFVANCKKGKTNLKDNSKSVPDLTVVKVPFLTDTIKKHNNPAYTNFFFTNTSAIIILVVVDSACSPILNRSKVYSGVYDCANISFYVYSSFGNKKISARPKFYKRFTTVSRFAVKLILSLFSPLIQTIFSSIKEITTAEMLQVILFVALLAICLVFCIVFLIIAFQNLINNRKDKSREQGSAQRDLECHEVRMKE